MHMLTSPKSNALRCGFFEMANVKKAAKYQAAAASAAGMPANGPVA